MLPANGGDHAVAAKNYDSNSGPTGDLRASLCSAFRKSKVLCSSRALGSLRDQPKYYSIIGIVFDRDYVSHLEPRDLAQIGVNQGAYAIRVMICTRPFLYNIICRNLFASEDQITQVMEVSGFYFLKSGRPVSGRNEEPRASRNTTIFRKSIDEFFCHDGMSMGRTLTFTGPQ
ncbi:MAG: hypothetical protein ACK6A8_19340 [Planctomycetota bacterium]|jgi:hypothetical protein